MTKNIFTAPHHPPTVKFPKLPLTVQPDPCPSLLALLKRPMTSFSTLSEFDPVGRFMRRIFGQYSIVEIRA